jgi:hypothetical protein
LTLGDRIPNDTSLLVIEEKDVTNFEEIFLEKNVTGREQTNRSGNHFKFLNNYKNDNYDKY